MWLTPYEENSWAATKTWALRISISEKAKKVLVALYLGCQNIITKTLVCSNIWNITALIKHEISQSVSFTREKLHQLTNLILLAPGNVLIYNLYVSLFFSGKPSWNLGNSQKIYLGQNGWFNNFWVPFWTSTLSWENFYHVWISN